MAGQSAALRDPTVRSSLGLRLLPPSNTENMPTMNDTWQAVREWVEERKALAKAEHARQSQVTQFPAQSQGVQVTGEEKKKERKESEKEEGK